MGFFSSLSGGNQRRNMNYAMNYAHRQYKRGLGEALEETDAGLNDVTQTLDPFVQSGNDATELYRTYLGLNGRPRQADAFQNYQTDPGFQAEVDYGLDQTQRSAAARGSMASGRTLAALMDRSQIHLRGAHQNRMSRLERLMSNGQGAAGALAGYQHGASQRRGDLKYGTRQMMANNMTNYMNARSQSQTQGANNIISGASSLLGSAVSGFSGMPTGGGGLSSLFGGGSSSPTNPSSWNTTTYTAPQAFGNNFSFGG